MGQHRSGRQRAPIFCPMRVGRPISIVDCNWGGHLLDRDPSKRLVQCLEKDLNTGPGGGPGDAEEVIRTDIDRNSQ